MDTTGADYASPYLPDDFFQNPNTARIWTSACPGADAQALVQFVTANFPAVWTFDGYHVDPDPSGDAVSSEGHTVLDGGLVLYAVVVSAVNPGMTPLSISFGSHNFGSDNDPTLAMESCVQALNNALRQQFGTFVVGGQVVDATLLLRAP